MQTVEIFCENTGAVKQYPLGITLDAVREDMQVQLANPVLGAIVNHKVKELPFAVVKSKHIRFIDYTHPDGQRMYVRSLKFLLYVAVREVLPDVKLLMLNGISHGYYCELHDLGRPLNETDITAITEAMRRLVADNVPFRKKGMLTTDAVAELKKQGLNDKATLFGQQGLLYSYLYYTGDYAGYFYGHLVPSTGYLTNFDLSLYFDGLLLQVPASDNFEHLCEITHLPKLLDVFKEHKKRVELLNVHNLGMLNICVEQGRGGELIKIAEALHEKEIVRIADIVDRRREEMKIILIAGPSSSGKTTFSMRLAVQLAVIGITPHQISLDDYFVDREHTPRDSNGNFDFEVLEAVDVKYFTQQLTLMFHGAEVEIPRFNFLTGKREPSGRKIRMEPGHVLIVEGIHGMNPRLIPGIDERCVLRIFLSALTQISLDDHNYIPTTDNRLLRRIIRDSKYRGYPAAETIRRWPSVRNGEERNIFPYQENADVMFNSALIYELAVLKKYAEPLLKAVPESAEEYCEANRLLKFLSYFRHLSDHEIPPTSLIREFLGGSSFRY
ncbi:MAG: nucleoside kinase [Bacteroidales bacterium]|jgi:uridine kinase|nr:nucleoside kinase [Bacteroidales bacterium]